MVLTAWRFLRHCSSPEEAEAEACLDGVRLAVDWIQQPVQVECDCLTLVKAICAGDGERAVWRGTIRDIISTSNLLPGCKFNHAGREANRASHGLARRALETEWAVMRFDMPDDIRVLVETEAARVVNSTNACNLIPIS